MRCTIRGLVVAAGTLAACAPDPSEPTPLWEGPAIEAPVAATVDDAPAVVAPARNIPPAHAGQRRLEAPDEPLEPVDTAALLPEETSPTCEILAPADGAVVTSGTSIYFEADADDPDGDALRLTWRSDPYGPMVLGNAFGFILPPGRHVVTLDVTDEQGNRCEDQVTVDVREP